MSTTHTATKTFKCAYCLGQILPGTKYNRRPEPQETGRFKTGQYHPECEEALIQELLKGKP